MSTMVSSLNLRTWYVLGLGFLAVAKAGDGSERSTNHNKVSGYSGETAAPIENLANS
jgi:hypothetical protein